MQGQRACAAMAAYSCMQPQPERRQSAAARAPPPAVAAARSRLLLMGGQTPCLSPPAQQSCPGPLPPPCRRLDGLSQRPDLRSEFEAFRSVTVFRADRQQGVPLMMLME